MKKRLCYILVFILTLCFTISNKNSWAKADEGSHTIRIGYIDYQGFIEKNEDGTYQGYGVELINKLAEYTGWEFEYVYDTWSNHLESLKNGDIDFLCQAQKTPEREEDYIFSDYPSGSESSVMYVREDDTRYYYNDYHSFSGMKIGFLEGSFQNGKFLDFSEKYGFSYNPIYYENGDIAFSALRNKEVDAVVMGSLAGISGYKVVSRIGADPFYFMTGKQNEQLLKELNLAMGELNAAEPYFTMELYQKYYAETDVSTALMFTRSEIEYINNSGPITVGLQKDRSPLSYEDEDGKAAGLTVELMEMISEKSGLKFQYRFLENGQAAYDFLDNTTARVVAGVMDSEFSIINENLIKSSEFFESNMAFIGRSGMEFDQNAELTLAIPKSFINGKEAVSKKYPNFKFYDCESTATGLDAIKDGKADIMMQNIYIAQEHLRSPLYENLEIIPVYWYEDSMIAVAEEKDSIVIGIIDKCINAISSEELYKIVLRNTTGKGNKITLAVMLYKYRWMLLGIGVLSAILFLHLVWIFKLRSRNYNQIKAANASLEEAVKQAEKANAAKSDFLSRMSHDIRTPMNAIIGITALAKDEAGKKEDMTEYIDEIERSSQFLLGLINDVLDMSKIESNALILHKEPYNLEEFIKQMKIMFDPMCREKNIELNIVADSKFISWVETDKIRFNQIFFNLMSNAVKYTGRNGKIEFIINRTGEEQYTFILKDNGIGMSREFQRNMFEPFSQEISDENMKNIGTGLGLAIVKNLVTLMDGDIFVKSDIGEGTEYIIKMTLKLCSEPADYRKEAGNDSTEEILNGSRVILCEDNELNREIAANLLEKRGMIVTGAENGQECVKIFEASEVGFYDAILMDLRMPVMNGIDAVKVIRKLNREDAAKIPIMAMTANAYEDDRKNTMSAGMNAHLSKPINPKLLYETLERYIREYRK